MCITMSGFCGTGGRTEKLDHFRQAFCQTELQISLVCFILNCVGGCMRARMLVNLVDCLELVSGLQRTNSLWW